MQALQLLQFKFNPKRNEVEDPGAAVRANLRDGTIDSPETAQTGGQLPQLGHGETLLAKGALGAPGAKRPLGGDFSPPFFFGGKPTTNCFLLGSSLRWWKFYFFRESPPRSCGFLLFPVFGFPLTSGKLRQTRFAQRCLAPFRRRATTPPLRR